MLGVLWGGWLLYWLVSARGNKPTVTRRSRRWLVVLLAVAGVGWFVLRQLGDYGSRQLVPAGPLWQYIGLAITAAGLGFSIWARRALGTNWSGMPDIKKDHELIQRGPYGLVRHPIYTGLLVAIFGSCLADGRVGSFAVFGTIVIMLIVKLKTEETLMLRQFPAQYRDYQRRVKALIPFIY